MISAIYLLDTKGKPLIYRHYRPDIPNWSIEKFMPLFYQQQRNMEDGSLDECGPLVHYEGIYYPYVRYKGLFFIAITIYPDIDLLAVYSFLYKMLDTFRDYFKLPPAVAALMPLEEEADVKFDESAIQAHFVVIYELLDEMMDFGYPQLTESRILQEFITQSRLDMSQITGQESKSLRKTVVPASVTSSVSWRSEGIFHRKNEVFVDVVETLDITMNASGKVVTADIIGKIKMKSELNGMPELKLGLNDSVLFEGITSPTTGAVHTLSGGDAQRGSMSVQLEDVKFHQCVKLSAFASDRTISFIPPDGDFDLLSYRLRSPASFHPVFWLESSVTTFSQSRAQLGLKLKHQLRKKLVANHLHVLLPVPEDAFQFVLKASHGTIKHVPDKKSILWNLRSFGGSSREPTCQIQYSLPTLRSSSDPLVSRVCHLNFELPYYTISGLTVRYLKIIEKSGYKALPWVRYLTVSGKQYSQRLEDPVVSTPAL